MDRKRTFSALPTFLATLAIAVPLLTLPGSISWAATPQAAALPESVEPYLKAARAGDPHAQYKLGEIYLQGRKANHTSEAVKWYQKAAKRGHVDAMAKLGVLYYAGLGVKESAKTSLKWFRQAALKGHAESQYHLGLMYAKGLGAQADAKRALKWFDLAAALDHSQAKVQKKKVTAELGAEAAAAVISANKADRKRMAAMAQKRASKKVGTSQDEESRLANDARRQAAKGRHQAAASSYRSAVKLALNSKPKAKAQKRITDYHSAITRSLSAMPAGVNRQTAQAARLPAGVEKKQMLQWARNYRALSGALQSGHTKQALETAKKMMATTKPLFGADHLLTLRTQVALGRALITAGQVDAGVAALKQSTDIAAKKLGVGHPEALSGRLLIASIQANKGDYAGAAKQYKAMATDAAKSLGANHGTSLQLALTSATMLSNSGQYGSAVKRYGQACQGYAQAFGNYHPQTAACYNQQAYAMSENGDLKEASVRYNETLTSQVAASGLDNPKLLETSIALADVQRRMGDYRSAELRLKPMLKLTEKRPDLQDMYFNAMNTMALVKQSRGDYLEAEKLTRKVLAYEVKSLGETHPNTIATRTNLAGLLRLQSRFAEAEVLYDQALASAKEGLGKKHPTSIAITNNLGIIYESQGLYDRAEPLFREALKSSREVLGAEHPTTLATTNSLALLYESQGNFDKAEPLYGTVITINRKRLGPEHPDTIAFLNNLAFLHMMQGNAKDAAELFEEVTGVWRKKLGVRHQRTLKSINNLGRARLDQQEYKAAEALIQEAWDGRREVLGETHIDTQRSMLDMARIYHKTGRSIKAQKLLQKTLELNEKTLGKQHPYTFETLDAMAAILETNNLLKDAYKVRHTAFERRTEFLNRMMWVTGDNAREGYVRLHRPEQNAYVALLPHVSPEMGGRGAIEVGLQRKGLLFKITSEVHQIARLAEQDDLKEITEKLRLQRKKLATMTLAGPSDNQSPEQHLKLMNTVEEAISELEGELGRASLKFRQTKQSITTEKLTEQLPEGAALVDFITYRNQGKSKLLAGIMTKDGGEATFSLATYPDDMETIQKQVIELRTSIQDEDMDEDDLLDLSIATYEMIWGPLTEILEEREQVFIVPDGILNILPFNAMQNEDETYMLEAKNLHILTSSRNLTPSIVAAAKAPQLTLAGPNYDTEEVVGTHTLAAVRGRRSANRAAVQVASSDTRGASRAANLRAGLRAFSRGMRGLKFDPLPGAEKEGKLIATTIKENKSTSELLIQNAAQEKVVKDIKEPPQVLHIATHGFYLKADERLKKRLQKMKRGAQITTTPPPGDNPMLRSGLAFAGINANAPYLGEIDTANDGVLTALEVLDLNLTGTRLAVLSACETGLGEIHEGEGVYGLRRAFQEAGVEEVIASLWEVSDAGTQALMTAFYKRLADGANPHDALRESQLEMMRSPQWGYPYIWSAFMSIGK
uniref:CHAT domain-containing protein n=1 Tax=Magnetococcus massalia (strain MO-1) TaxID=451514 RepID=A0A1S7LNH5_MAGMO|nr:Conserved mambrane protein of unknown function. TPR repeat-containing protein. Highly conserved in MTB of MC-1, AMB-1 and MSR-1 [Candidatus Magnetococcus massalia]